jgi:hypothetical protein
MLGFREQAVIREKARSRKQEDSSLTLNPSPGERDFKRSLNLMISFKTNNIKSPLLWRGLGEALL